VLLTSGLLEQHAQPAMAVPLKSSDGLRCITQVRLTALPAFFSIVA